MSEGFTCRGCGNFFFQAPKCVGCGAQKLYDSTVKGQWREIESQAARITKLEALLQEAAVELHTYIDAEYPSRLFYADEKRKHNRDMEIVFRIQSALEGGKDE